MFLLFRIIEKILTIYFILYLIIDIGLFLYSFIAFRKRKPKPPTEHNEAWTDHPVTIIVPAYNEEVSIVHCTQMLLQLDYPNYEIIVVNDGSTDQTIEKLKDSFVLLEQPISSDCTLNTEPILCIYKANGSNLKVLDKKNGGKADSLNAAINYATGRYICTIDADSILDNQALKSIVRPFIQNKKTMVTGGQLAASNDVVLKDNRVVSSKIPTNIWVLWQIIEYIKSFLVSRLGLSRLNALLLMSGAFSLYRRDELFAVGGFLSKQNNHPYITANLGEGLHTVCEDMEIVVRLFRYRHQQKQKAKAVFLANPVCWTEMPSSGRNIFKQRARWHQGLTETLQIHKAMILEPRYGVTGLVGLPYYFFFEMLAPVIKLLAVIFIIVSIFLDILNAQWVLLMLLAIMVLTAVITSSITVIVESWSKKQSSTNRDALRYKTFKDWLILILAGIIGEFSYSFFKQAAQLKGFINFLGKKDDWKKFERKGIQQL